MHLTLTPIRGLPGDPETTLSVSGDVLTVDGIPYDLSSIPEGAEATPEGEHPFAGTITRQDGVVRCTVIVRLGDDATPNQPVNPAHWIIPDAEGDVTIPAARIEPEPETEPEVQA